MPDVPDYPLAAEVEASTPTQIRAVTDPTRSQILDLVLERAASVTELAAALGRPKSSIAHHVDALVDAGMLVVVRTRQVRAMEERFYGRTARTIIIGDGGLPDGTRPVGFLDQAVAERTGAELATLRHVRINEDRAIEFFTEVAALAERFTTLPRSGDTVFGFVAAVYPTDHPTLPEPR